MPIYENNSVKLHYRERGQGIPFVFQHGLGASVGQPFELFQEPSGIRLLGFDARGHGLSELGPPDKISLSTSAGDLLALLDFLKLERAIIGGISMGAAIALNFALRHTNRVLGLVISRPAWLATHNPFNVHTFSRVAELMECQGAEAGRKTFEESPEYAELLRQFPDTAKSLAAQFTNPRLRDIAINLKKIPPCSPFGDLKELTGLRVPTLVLANRQDPIHPFEYGPTIARQIPGAEFQELTSKSVNLDRHVQEFGQFLADFLIRNFLKSKK